MGADVRTAFSVMSSGANQSSPRVAIVYDRLNSHGGAEKVLQELQTLYPEAPLYTSVYDAPSVPWLDPKRTVITSWLQYVPGAKTHHQWFGWLMPFLFESFDFSEYDIIVSISSESAKGVLTQPDQLHINYMLTPTRYLWSHAAEYELQLPRLIRPLARLVFCILRAWDATAANRPDVVVPISQLVQNRVKEFYRRETRAPLYPPADVSPEIAAPKGAEMLPESFFFSWGRHVAYKQFDTVIAASVYSKIPVVLAGNGPETKRLQALSRTVDAEGQYIFFVGECNDAELRWYLEKAAGSLFPQIEDFGIVILESLLSGCPAIVNEKSGAAELMTKHDGFKISESTPRILAESMQKMRAKPWQRLDIQKRARQYAGVRFSQEWDRLVQSEWKKHQQALRQSTERNL